MICDSCNAEYEKKPISDSDEDLGCILAAEIGFIDVESICVECESLMLDILNG